MNVGVVGHRYLDSDQTQFVQACCRSLLSRISQNHNVVALTALAEGTDTIFAEQALHLNLDLGVVLPFHNYVDDFQSKEAEQRFYRLKNAATFEYRTDYVSRSDDAYLEAMNWIVDKSDLTIIAWSGKQYMGLRATERAVCRCTTSNKHWVHLDVHRLALNYRVGGDDARYYV